MNCNEDKITEVVLRIGMVQEVSYETFTVQNKMSEPVSKRYSAVNLDVVSRSKVLVAAERSLQFSGCGLGSRRMLSHLSQKKRVTMIERTSRG